MDRKYKLKLYWVLFSSFFSSSLLAQTQVTAEKLTPAESLVPMLLGLGGILALIFFLAILVKKVTGLNIVSNSIKVLESQSLGAKEKLVIVEIQKQQYVLGVTAHSINQICQLQEKIEKKQPAVSFDKLMQQFLKPSKNIKCRSENVIDVESNSSGFEVK